MPPRLLGSFAPQPLQPAADPQALCRQALCRPIAAAPLATRDLRGKRVLLVSDDHSRPTPVHRFFGPVRAALLQAGASLDQIEVLFAVGTHRPMTRAEAETKIGKENLSVHRWHNHNAFDPTQLTHLGTTARGTAVWLNRRLAEFDLIVTLGAIEPHILAGFSGGYKTILPGCAGAATSGHNHLLGLDGDGFNHVGALPEESPMRLNLEEGAALLGREVFIVNAALNPDGQPVAFFCGDARAAFRAGTDFVRRASAVEVPEAADVVLTNSRPFDLDLRQGLKCIGNTLQAARPGGLVLGFLRCVEGRGAMSLPAWTLPYPVLKPMLHVCNGVARVIHDWVRKHDPVEQRFLGHLGLQMLRRNHLWFYSDGLSPDVGKQFGLIRQFRTVEELIAAALRRVGPRATVAVFPLGGATYTRGPRPKAAQQGVAPSAGSFPPSRVG